MGARTDVLDDAKHDGGTTAPEAEAACTEIMEATYRALCEHGAAELSVQAIADEFDKSKSLIFYHYDSKEQLLSAFLAYLLDGFERRVAATVDEDPDERLDRLIDALLFDPGDNEDFQIAMFELRSQAPFNDAYREQFRTNRSNTHDLFESVIERGIEDGVFADVDASQVVTEVFTIVDGARTQLVVFGDGEILDTTREMIDAHLAARLFADDGGETE
jgi:AcrR family transcriptional regulator